MAVRTSGGELSSGGQNHALSPLADFEQIETWFSVAMILTLSLPHQIKVHPMKRCTKLLSLFKCDLLQELIVGSQNELAKRRLF
jgi:hypothetical protein